jgi:hypothetical protein
MTAKTAYDGVGMAEGRSDETTAGCGDVQWSVEVKDAVKSSFWGDGLRSSGRTPPSSPLPPIQATQQHNHFSSTSFTDLYVHSQLDLARSLLASHILLEFFRSSSPQPLRTISLGDEQRQRR